MLLVSSGRFYGLKLNLRPGRRIQCLPAHTLQLFPHVWQRGKVADFKFFRLRLLTGLSPGFSTFGEAVTRRVRPAVHGNS